ncbi:MAG: hypothetical protein R2687_04830 [Candidatus Nanopelagicales bacterium]
MAYDSNCGARVMAGPPGKPYSMVGLSKPSDVLTNGRAARGNPAKGSALKHVNRLASQLPAGKP